MRRKKSHFRSVVFWLGFLIIAINQLIEVTFVTTQGLVESATFTFSNVAGSALLPLGGYIAIGVGLRLFGKKPSAYRVPLRGADVRSGS